MNRSGSAFLVALLVALAVVSAARADTLDGVILSYESGNKGTDITVRTSDGRIHDLWFDNLRKPVFQGKELPWCPEFPCTGWPKQLVLQKTRVRLYLVKQTIDGKSVETPTRIVLLR